MTELAQATAMVPASLQRVRLQPHPRSGPAA